MPYKIPLIFLLFFGGQIQAQNNISMPKPLELAFKNGDYEVISSYFDANVELSVLGVDKIYSNNQAKYVLKRFFSNHKTKNYIINHQGVKANNTHYAGTLITDNDKFKIIILLKKNTSETKLHQLRIENE